MKLTRLIFLFGFLLYVEKLYSQDEFLYSSDGRTILRQRELIQNCLKSLNKTKIDQTALAICECQTTLLNRYFTYRQFKKHTKNGIININKLIEEDSVISKNIDNCFKSSGQVTLLTAQSDEKKFVSSCMLSIQKTTEKNLDTTKLKSFCTCELELIKTKKFTDVQLESMKNPNSLLFYEMLYKCGNPFAEQGDEFRNWNTKSTNDLRGPDIDTVSILNLDGMTYVKLKIGSLVQIWLFDTGASDLLITKDMEKILREEKVIGDTNYLGIGEYEMANGAIDSCKRYRINNVKIGDFSVDNITIAVSEKGKKIIAGKTLFNKFAKWTLNNEQSELILWK
jgi:hypothetical protein